MLNLLSTFVETYGLKFIILGYLTILLGLPLAFIVLPILGQNRALIFPLGRAVTYSILFGWAFLFVWRIHTEFPWNRDQLIGFEREMYDGNDGNGEMLFFGWLYMLAGVFPAVLIRMSIEHIRTRRLIAKPTTTTSSVKSDIS
jgi:hypothetical protein